MLKALLHRKLRRVAVIAEDEDDDSDTEDAAPELTGLEDPLTSAVFERFAYLPPELAWALLRGAGKPLGGGPAMAETPPEGQPSWSFWPNLKPGEYGNNKNLVQPDVLVSWGDTLILIEAKHRGAQDPSQWVEQIRAARGAPAYSGKKMWLLAVGGIDGRGEEEQIERVRRELGNELPGMLTMRWEDLREELYSLEGQSSAIVHDIAAALDAWGYRRKTWFSSLPNVTTRLRADETMAVLQGWRVR